MKHSRRMAGLLLAAALLFCTAGGYIYASSVTETSVTNQFSTGIVNIDLKEYQLIHGEKQPWTEAETVLPGEQISKIPEITNLGNDCYVRVKFAFRQTDLLSDRDCYGLDERWMKGADGYYYSTRILKEGEQIKVFDGIRIPEDFPEELAEHAFDLDITAEAVQSQNFQPDFTADDPWHGIDIQICQKDGQYDLSTFKEGDNQPLSVVYQGKSGTLITNRDDFFTNLPYLMPGDSYTDTVQLKNTGNNPINLYFHTGTDSHTERETDGDLLEKLQLTITTTIAGKTQELYQGPLHADRLQTPILLGQIRNGSADQFTFTITVPAELDNSYTILHQAVKWIFSTETIVNGKPVEDDVPQTAPPVYTGDYAIWGLLLIMVGLCLGSAAIVLARKKKDCEETKRCGR